MANPNNEEKNSLNGMYICMAVVGVCWGFSEANESAKSKGIPAPFAFLWAIIAGIGALYLITG